jgi:hypothetical protein
LKATSTSLREWEILLPSFRYSINSYFLNGAGAWQSAAH